MKRWYYWIRFKLGLSISIYEQEKQNILIAYEQARIAREKVKQAELNLAYARGSKDGFADAKKYFEEMKGVATKAIEELKNEERPTLHLP